MKYTRWCRCHSLAGKTALQLRSLIWPRRYYVKRRRSDARKGVLTANVREAARSKQNKRWKRLQGSDSGALGLLGPLSAQIFEAARFGVKFRVGSLQHRTSRAAALQLPCNRCSCEAQVKNTSFGREMIKSSRMQ